MQGWERMPSPHCRHGQQAWRQKPLAWKKRKELSAIFSCELAILLCGNETRHRQAGYKCVRKIKSAADGWSRGGVKSKHKSYLQLEGGGGLSADGLSVGGSASAGGGGGLSLAWPPPCMALNFTFCSGVSKSPICLRVDCMMARILSCLSSSDNEVSSCSAFI